MRSRSLGAAWAHATGINGLGTIIVGYTAGGGTSGIAGPIRWDGLPASHCTGTATPTALGGLPGADAANAASGIANAVSLHGEVIVGHTLDGNNKQKAFRWTRYNGMESIEQLLVSSGAGFRDLSVLTDAVGVDDTGTIIAGNGNDTSNGGGRAWRAYIPLPPTPVLQLSPSTGIVSAGNQGGPFSPNMFQYQLSSTSGIPNYTITGVPTWLTAPVTSGTASTSQTQINFNVNASANSLTPGVYTATISFNNTTTDVTDVTITAELDVSMYNLSVNASSGGTVSSSPSGISCGATCSAAFTSGSQVTLNEMPASGYFFSGWGGACSGTGSCVVTMNADENVTATFTPSNYTLSVGVTGGGTVTSSPSGISCGSTCSASFATGSQVTLNEAPGNGYIFSGWGGACSGIGSCVVTMSAPESVTATFTQEALTRTFVSSSGVDVNSCTIAAPCATFARAYTVTQSSGIIAALDPGKYGPLTITYPVTVNGNGWAAITAPAQGNGITINAGSGNVNLIGLEVDGAGAAYNGIVFNSGSSLTVSNCIVKDFISSNGTSGNGTS